MANAEQMVWVIYTTRDGMTSDVWACPDETRAQTVFKACLRKAGNDLENRPADELTADEMEIAIEDGHYDDRCGFEAILCNPVPMEAPGSPAPMKA